MGGLWLRAETKPHERRTPLLPEHAAQLVHSGHQVVVERAATRIIDDAAYAAAGCRLVAAGSWPDAPADHFILGLKELPAEEFPLRHAHIYYAHCYKDQQHSRQVLRRFVTGGGTLLDCEYLADEHGHALTVNEIGRLSGYVGAAMALQFFFQKAMRCALALAQPYFPSRAVLISHVVGLARDAGVVPSVVVVGERGNAGGGAAEFCREVGVEAVLWGRAETGSPEVLATLNQFDVVLNCIGTDEVGPPFLREADLAVGRLSVLADVTCDVGSPVHRFPFYSRITTFDDPVLAVGPADAPVHVLAIDHLTTWLPAEASALIAEPLFAPLQELLAAQPGTWPGPWRTTRELFVAETKGLRGVR